MEFVPGPHDCAYPFLCLREKALGRRLHDNRIDDLWLPVEQPVHRRPKRRDHVVVERHAERAPLRLAHANDGVGETADLHGTPDGIETRKESLHEIRAEDHGIVAEREFLLGEEPAAGDVELLDGEIVAVDGEDVSVARPRVWRLDLEVVLGVHRPAGAFGKCGDHGLDVHLHDPLAATVLLPYGLVHVAKLHVGAMAQLERIDPDDLAHQVFFHVAPHAVDDGHDGDEEHHANAHTQEREKALEFLHANRAEGEADGIEKGHARLTPFGDGCFGL